MQKPTYLNSKMYIFLLESLSIKNDSVLNKYSNKKTRNGKIIDILNNPSPYLLQECKIFNSPEILDKVIFDIYDLEFMFNNVSIKDISNKKDKITVKRVIDNENISLLFTDIKKTFKKGCTIDCQEN